LKPRVRRKNDLLRYWLPWIAFSAAILAVGWLFTDPAPPGRVTIATGSPTGAYHAFGEAYAGFFARNAVRLDVRTTSGSLENYRLLLDGRSGVDIAIVQGGTAPRRDSGEGPSFRAIASLFLEPVWLFVGGDVASGGLDGLRGKRISIGPEESGTRAVALQILETVGLGGAGAARLEMLETGLAVEALKKGDLDAAFFVSSPAAPFIRDLLAAEGIRLVSFERSEALARVFPYLRPVKLPRGVIDLGADLPREDFHLVAPVASLVARESLHPAFVPLFLEAATRIHEPGGLLAEPGTFPSPRFVEFPLDEAARDYFRSGPPFLQRYLPFWVAAAVNRLKILLLPLITLLFPIFKVAPPLLRWRARRRIYRWYAVLEEIEREAADAPARAACLERLAALEEEISRVHVPLSYGEEHYNLRLHAEYVRRRVEAGS
jgi:TRAP transporter TAXI family solute receptor